MITVRELADALADAYERGSRLYNDGAETGLWDLTAISFIEFYPHLLREDDPVEDIAAEELAMDLADAERHSEPVPCKACLQRHEPPDCALATTTTNQPTTVTSNSTEQYIERKRMINAALSPNEPLYPDIDSV